MGRNRTHLPGIDVILLHHINKFRVAFPASKKEVSCWSEGRPVRFKRSDLSRCSAMVEWHHPNPQVAFRVNGGEGDSLSVRRQIEVVHNDTGEDSLCPARLQVGHPEFSRSPVTRDNLVRKVEELLSVRREDGTRR